MARRGDTAAVQALLYAGAKASAKEDEGKTALTYAAENPHTDIVELLKKAGAKE
ncbi:MAG: ankyrin repeat domain-containing protein [Terriglobia bacterium]